MRARTVVRLRSDLGVNLAGAALALELLERIMARIENSQALLLLTCRPEFQVSWSDLPWATTEYVVLDGAAQLPVEPLTLNPPFPCTRSGFLKVTFLVTAKPDTDYAAFFDHWLSVHAPNVAETALAAGGFRYVVSHSLEPEREPYAGMAELYFADLDGWRRYRQQIQPDGMEPP